MKTLAVGGIFCGLLAILVACLIAFGGSGSNLPSAIAATYTRPGTKINIVFTTAQGFYGYPGVGQDFSATQISLMEAALDTLTDQQIIHSGLTTVIPAPQKLHDEGKWGPTILLDPNDPNLVTHFLTLLGFPPASTTTGSQTSAATQSGSIPSPQSSMISTTPLNVRGSEVLSSHSPSDYVPVTSPMGLQSVLDDSNMVKNYKTNKHLTLQDQIRPHGDVPIVPSVTQHN